MLGTGWKIPADAAAEASASGFDAQWQLISERIRLLVSNGLSGLLLVVAVLYFFLPGRVAFWVMVGVPTAFLATLALM